MAFSVGNKFSSYDEFKSHQILHEDAVYTKLVVADSRPLKTNRRDNVTDADIQRLKFSTIVLKCKYFGTNESTATVRKTSTYKKACIYQVNVVCQRNATGVLCLRITAMTTQHIGHQPSEAAYYDLPSLRRRSIHESREFVENTLDTRANKRLIQNTVNNNPNRTGGKVILKDLHNEKARLTRLTQPNLELDDLSLLVLEMLKIKGSVVKLMRTALLKAYIFKNRK